MESIGKLEVTNKMGFGVGLGWEKLAESGLNTDFGLVVGWGKKLIQVYAAPGGISQILSAPNVGKMAICASFEFERLCTCLPASGRGCGNLWPQKSIVHRHKQTAEGIYIMSKNNNKVVVSTMDKEALKYINGWHITVNNIEAIKAKYAPDIETLKTEIVAETDTEKVAALNTKLDTVLENRAKELKPENKLRRLLMDAFVPASLYDAYLLMITHHGDVNATGELVIKQSDAMKTTLAVTESYSDVLTGWFRDAGIVNVTPLTVEKAARRIEALMPTRKDGADSIKGLSASAFKDFFMRAFYMAFIGNNHCFSVAKTGAITLAPVGEPAEDLTKAE